MTTLRRELRQTINRVLEDYGLSDGDSEPAKIVDNLADEILKIPFFAKASASERFSNLPQMGKNSTQLAQKRAMLAERIEAQLMVTVDHNKKVWVNLLNKIVAAEEKGESFEKYMEWYRAGNEYNRPKTFQIARNPDLIWGNWKEAQAFGKVEVQKPDNDGGLYV